MAVVMQRSAAPPRKETMVRPRSLSVVVPVFNEEAILKDTVDDILAGLDRLALDQVELILCENGSTDATRDIASAAVDAHPFVRLLTMDRPDYGAALRAGLLATEGEVAVSFDADYYDFAFVEHALAVDGDVVVAAKGLNGSHDRRSLLRRFASRSFGLLTRGLLAVSVGETHGMKLFRERALELVPSVAATNDLFDTELLAVAERAGLAIDELPITTEDKRPSRSGLLSRVPRTVLGLLEIRARLRANYPSEPGPVTISSASLLDAVRAGI